jgi:hypothetical protein
LKDLETTSRIFGLDARKIARGRRRLARGGAVCALCLLWLSAGRGAFATDTLLPNGTNFTFWEQPLSFSKTYYVDGSSPRGDDNGPGTSEQPFHTISKAAEILQPGQRVVISSGVYRECVRPARGGTGPDQMISYEAAPGATVFIKASETLNDGWQPSSAYGGRGGGASQISVWQHDLKGSMFPDAYNPFGMVTMLGDRAWLDTKTVDLAPYLRRRGLIFVDGKPLEPVELARDLGDTSATSNQPAAFSGGPTRNRAQPIMQEIGGTPEGKFWVEYQGTTLHMRLPTNAGDHPQIEITAREQAFIPQQSGLGYIRIKGITFQHAGNAFPPPQHGLVSTRGGNHWIIESNTIEWAFGVGLDIGSGGATGPRAAQPVGFHVIRGNTIRYCGVEGIGGMGTQNTLVEDNLIEWVGWADAERAWESAGAKFHNARNMLFRHNVVRHIRHANGLWLDSGNVNCRITGNVFADVLTVSAAIHIEATQQQNQIDNNIIWNVRNAEPGTPGQRGCAGSGIFIHATDHLIIAQNLIGRCDNAGIFPALREDRIVGTRGGTTRENKFYNNIFFGCGKAAIVFMNEHNSSDGNLYASLPGGYLRILTPEPQQWLDLAAVRDFYGWDKNGALATLQVNFDPDRLELTMTSDGPVPKVGLFNHIDTDMFGKAAGESRLPGPFTDPGTRPVRQVDPRSTVRP